MKPTTVKLTVEIPISRHTQLKTECSKHRIKMNKFVEEWISKGLKELVRQELIEDLKLGIEEARQGRVQEIGSLLHEEESEEIQDIRHRTSKRSNKKAQGSKGQTSSFPSSKKNNRTHGRRSSPSLPEHA